MVEISEDVLRQAREAAEPMKDLLQGGSGPGGNGFTHDNSSRNMLSDASQVVDSFDTQLAKAVAQEKAQDKTIEHERGIEHGREL
jgi:hypothetical protein